ncbi:MAG: alpha/beta hydrolase [Mariniphaga sp.]|nr:alpha/beta hydrolase [Mariniphaga sp.]MDD4425197.1 alpha/beta hydrolase [Mariniphaga sp.]
MKQILMTLSFVVIQTTILVAQEVSVEMKKMIYKHVNQQELYVDMFCPSGEPKTNSTAIALFHGGGWVNGDPSEFHEACRWFARRGYVTFSFQYRLCVNDDGTYPHPEISPSESVKDARSAMRWLKENAASLKIDPEKIVVGGQSAGGQLALATALMDTINESTDNLKFSPEPVALLLYSSNVNTLEPWIDNLFGEKRRDEIWSVSPYHNLKKMPPAVAFRGEADCMVIPYIVDFFKRKTIEMGNEFLLYSYPGRSHYLGEGNDKYAEYFDEEILERSLSFLKQKGL